MKDGASVLVVDDDPVTRQMLSGTLEERGHRVKTAGDGRQGLDLVRSERFDVVLLDVLMPHLNGYDVLEHMKGDEELRHIPVVMVTSVDEVESAVRCIELGADDYLSKPIDPVLLIARVNAGLNKKRLHDLEQEHLEEVARLNRQLEARVEEQMAELVRTGELKRFLPHQVAEGLLAGQLSTSDGFERRKADAVVRRHGRVHGPVRHARARGALGGAERVPAGDDGRGGRARGDAGQLHRRRPDGHLRGPVPGRGARAGLGGRAGQRSA